MALESIEATLNDHIIFAGEDTLSFAQCGWLGQIKEEVRDYRREELQAARGTRGCHPVGGQPAVRAGHAPPPPPGKRFPRGIFTGEYPPPRGEEFSQSG